MTKRLPLPSLNAESPDTAELRRYLFRLVEELDNILAQMQDGGTGEKDGGGSITIGSTELTEGQLHALLRLLA